MAQMFRVPNLWDGKTRENELFCMCHIFWDGKRVMGYDVATLRISKMLSYGLDGLSVLV